MKKKTYICMLILLMGLWLPSCSKDDDNSPDAGTSSLKIDGKGIEKILSAVCEEGSLSGENWITFFTQFMFEGDMVSFSMELDYPSVSKLKTGEDITDELEVTRFYVISGNDNSNIGLDGSSSSRYYNIENGKVTVNSISGSKVILQFKNLVISKEIGNSNKTFTLSGTLSYHINLRHPI